MVLEITTIEGTVVVVLPRRFDFDSAPQVEKELQPVIAEHPERILFDFAKTEYISSVGMRAILSLSRSLRDGGGTIALSSLCRQVEYIFEITGFTKLFPVYGTREKALKHLQKKR
jgi:anti-anti-sigma factor